MMSVHPLQRRKNAQTLVFFLIAFGTIFLLCGLAIDSGLLYLAKARLSRAVDGAALAAVGNFHQSDDPVTNRQSVALIMRNFALANFTDLASTDSAGRFIPTTATEQQSGTTSVTYTYSFNDGSFDPNGQPRRYVEVVLTTGAGGQITTATCNARCPVQTYFIGYAGGIIGGFGGVSSLKDLKVSSAAVATRNPRLIEVIVDRSSSMLQPGGGAYQLAAAIVTFLNFFDTSSDYIGIVSFSSNARVEMPLTTNFLIAGTNNLYDTFQYDYVVAPYNSGPAGQPGVDPEQYSTNSDYDTNYSSYTQTGVRRMKFGGTTAADEGLRLGMEQLMANSGFYNPSVVKYIVLFTDGAWNNSRTLIAAPGYTNVIINTNPAPSASVKIVTNSTPDLTQNLGDATNVVFMPSLSPLPGYTNAVSNLYFTPSDHYLDKWQSLDTNNTLEPLPGSTPSTVGPQTGAPMLVTGSTYLGTFSGTKVFTTSVNVWLQPGAVDYVYTSGSSTPSAVYVSDYTNPTQTVNIALTHSGDSNVLVVPGYIVDGILNDALDLGYSYAPSTYTFFKYNNFNEGHMWPDDTAPAPTVGFSYAPYFTPYNVNSQMRNLLFRNYVNLLTGFYVFRPDDPLGLGIEHFTGAQRPLHGLGPYYPSAGFYWPFDLVGVDYDITYMLINPTTDTDATGLGLTHHISYSINMLSAAAAPEWSGEWFFNGTGAALSGTTAASSAMTSASAWQGSMPGWMTAFSSVMTTDAVHDSNISPSPANWRPSTYNGSNFIVSGGAAACLPGVSSTGGFVTDGAGTYYKNAMAWSGRPTHYYDFSTSSWITIKNNHAKNIQALALGNWKSLEYAWHARNLGVTIYTVGFGTKVLPAQQVILAQVANSTNTTAGNPQTVSGSTITSYTPGVGTSMPYNPAQPIGQQFFGTNATEISNDFYSVGQAINASLTQ